MSYIGNSPGVASQRVTTTLTATAGQTQFTTLSGYILGYVDVYLNGAKLVNGTDFEAITGTYITLFAAAELSDVVELVSYVPRGLTDGYTKAEADAKFLDTTGDTATGTVTLPTLTLTGTLTANSSAGTNGQYLQSTGTGLQWATVNALPTQTGNSGKYLTTNGTAASWATIAVGDVTLTGTQTLTNKTLTAPTITNGVLTGTLTTGPAIGGGLFNGTNAVATIADAAALRPGTGDFTVEFWMKTDSSGTDTYSRLFSKGNYSTSGNFQLEYSNGNDFLLHIDSGMQSYTSPVTVSSNTWYYIAVSRVSGTVYFYVNGQRIGSGQTQNGSINNTAVFYVGGSGDTTFYRGSITNFRYVVGTGLYSSTSFTVPTAPLTAVTNTQLLMLFNNGTSATLLDSSSAARTITNNNVTQASSYVPNTLIGGGTGTSGQYLKSTGTGVEWATVNALPTQTSNSGKYLTTDGTSASWVTLNLAAGGEAAQDGLQIAADYGSFSAPSPLRVDDGDVANWASTWTTRAVGAYSNVSGLLNQTTLSTNAYYSGSSWYNKTNNPLAIYTQSSGQHIWQYAAAQTPGTITPTTHMTLTATGELQARVPVAANGIVVNSLTISTSYTIAAGYSGMSAGPVTLASGVTVTVASGSRWVVL
jgi:hypothetical protein